MVRCVGFGAECGLWSPAVFLGQGCPGEAQTLIEAANDRQKSIEVKQTLPGERLEHFNCLRPGALLLHSTLCFYKYFTHCHVLSDIWCFPMVNFQLLQFLTLTHQQWFYCYKHRNQDKLFRRMLLGCSCLALPELSHRHVSSNQGK